MNPQPAKVLGRGAWFAVAVLLALFSTALPAAQSQNPRPDYGTNVASTLGMLKTREMGFHWVRAYYPEQAAEAELYGLKALLLVGWEQPLTDVRAFGDYVYQLVSRYRGRISAYQICNEPNLAEMWHKPKYADPSEYVAYLREAYLRAKQADPGCIIVSAGLALNGGAGDLAMDDVAFLRGMYAAGAQFYFDVLAVHSYGFAYPPEDTTSNPIHCFRRAEQERAVMVQYGDGAKPVWATEFGWIIDPGEGCHEFDGWPGRWWQRVPAQVQADYLVRAFRYARTYWPWMQVMFVWNMDYDLVPWNDYCDQKSWFAVLNHDGTPRPAFWELQRLALGPATPTPSPTLWPSRTSTSLPTATALPTRTSTPLASATPTATLPVDPTAVPSPLPTSSPGTASVAGRVLLQGRSNHAGALVSVGGRSATSAQDGSFRIEGVPAGLQELSLQMAGYIQHRRSGVTVNENETLALPEIQLRAGDINGDGVVSLFDLVAVSTHYGLQVPGGTAEDVNGDGEVSLLDLVLVSTNYGAGG